MSSYIGRFVYIPTDFLQGASGLIFFYIGDIVKDFNLLKITKDKPLLLFICILLLPFGFLIKTTGMVDLNYSKNYPLMVLVAMAGCYIVYKASYCIKDRNLGRLLSFFGRLSLLVLSVHLIDLNLHIVARFLEFFPRLEFNGIGSTSLHLFWALFVSFIISRCKLIKQIYKI